MQRPHAPRPPIVALAALSRATRLWRLVLALLLCAVSYLALAPAPAQETHLGWDKLNHLVAFAALAFAGTWGFPRAPARVAAALLAFGGLIEVLQSFTPNRFAEWGDLLADVLGLCIGLALARGMGQVASRCAQPR